MSDSTSNIHFVLRFVPYEKPTNTSTLKLVTFSSEMLVPLYTRFNVATQK